VKVLKITALKKFLALIFIFALSGFAAVHAGEVEIVKVKAENQRGSWVFHVTLKHADSGWDHYADAWRVVTESGKELGTRTLFHPHVDEQPFTRSLADVSIPADISEVYIEAHDKVHGWSKQRYKVKIR